MSGTDATRCKVCGGQFSAKRVIIDGCAYHERCAGMSYPSHTHEDYSRLSDELSLTMGALDAAIHLINGLRTGDDCPADLLQAAERGFEDRLTDLRACVGRTL